MKIKDKIKYEIFINFVKNLLKLMINLVLHLMLLKSVLNWSPCMIRWEKYKKLDVSVYLKKMEFLSFFFKYKWYIFILNSQSHQAFIIFTTKSTINYNLGPNLEGSDLRQGLSLFLRGFDKIYENFRVFSNLQVHNQYYSRPGCNFFVENIILYFRAVRI